MNNITTIRASFNHDEFLRLMSLARPGESAEDCLSRRLREYLRARLLLKNLPELAPVHWRVV